MGDRDSFLARVRQAVAEGNRAGGAPPLPERGRTASQGAGPDPVTRFADELAAAGGRCHLVPDAASAVAAVVRLVQDRSARSVLLDASPFLDTLGLAEALTAAGLKLL